MMTLSNIVIIFITGVIILTIILLITLDNEKNTNNTKSGYGQSCSSEINQECDIGLTCITFPNEDLGICRRNEGQGCIEDIECASNLFCNNGVCSSNQITLPWKLLKWSRPIVDNISGNWTNLYLIPSPGKIPCLTSYDNNININNEIVTNDIIIYAPDISIHTPTNYNYYLLQNGISSTLLIHHNTQLQITPYNIHFLSGGQIAILVNIIYVDININYIVLATIHNNVLSLQIPPLSNIESFSGTQNYFQKQIPIDFTLNNNNLAVLFSDRNIYTQKYTTLTYFPLYYNTNNKFINLSQYGINIGYTIDTLSINNGNTILFENNNYGIPIINNMSVSQYTTPELIYIQKANIPYLNYVINSVNTKLDLIVNSNTIPNIAINDFNFPSIYIMTNS
jgi:hypothetical protein